MADVRVVARRRRTPESTGLLGAVFLVGRVLRGAGVGLLLGGLFSLLLLFLALFAFAGPGPVRLGPLREDRRLDNTVLLLVAVLGALTAAGLVGYYAADSWVGAAWGAGAA